MNFYLYIRDTHFVCAQIGFRFVEIGCGKLFDSNNNLFSLKLQ